MGMTTNYKGTNLVQYFQAMKERAIIMPRPVAQAGIQVFYDRVKLNVSKLGRKTGNLANSIYQVYSKDNSTDTRAVYQAGWNNKKAPHGINVEFGHMIRYQYYVDAKTGHIRPKIRPEMVGKPRPDKKNRAEMDAYYVTLPQPKWVPPKAFLRGAKVVAPQAMLAMKNEAVSWLFYGETSYKGVPK
jgi:predicted small secreted protein